MFARNRGGALAGLLSTLTTIILIQIVASWLLVHWLARRRRPGAVDAVSTA